MKNIKNRIPAMILPLFLISTLAHAAEFKLGVVNLQRALVETAKGKAAKGTLEKESNAKRAEMEKKQNELKKMDEELKKKAAVLSEKAQMQKQAEFQQKFAEFQQAAQMAQMDLQKREQDLTRPIIEGLRALVPEVSRAHELDAVFEASSGALLYAKSQTDITEELISAYDKKNK